MSRKKENKDTQVKKPWGGRFANKTSGITEEISASVHFDGRLYRQDIRGSIAHARMLNRIGVLSDLERDEIIIGLEGIRGEIEQGTFEFETSLEDVHMNIEARLTEKIGDAGRKLHTARSRNDQVALDLRLYVRDEAALIKELLRDLVQLLAERAEEHLDLVMPGYTHLQVAQPVRFSHHLLAHAWALVRDMGRLRQAVDSCAELPLGSGALGGVNYPADREFLRKELGFARITPNSMDAVSDRDFVLDFLYFAAVLGTHLSRFCEELVLWSSAEFGFIRLSDSVTTGSSIMPQKRNPDIAELVRGKTGRLYGNLVSLLTALKGLPLTYNRDLQEDKEPLFDSVDTVKLALRGMIEMIASMTVDRDAIGRALYRNFSTATDLADYLARKGVPFRRSHEIVGSLVRHCESEKIDFFTMTAAALREFAPEFGDDAAALLDPVTSPERKLSAGGTSLTEVKKQLARLKSVVSEEGK